ncbi:hypothetical protein AVEN_8301-1 [Araneus ventricosus]|uniref:Uncharacterized protein n=1 Tax=Araneus ventricosus TaxID=182803 RepID=A0A4Y2KZZ8_ARAVE|nr:hypothetical protein AVEN_8301-1 [Araneus ventricosus]
MYVLFAFKRFHSTFWSHVSNEITLLSICIKRIWLSVTDLVRMATVNRSLASEPPIAVVVAGWEPLCTSQPAAALQSHIILPSPQTTLNTSGGKQPSTTHCHEFK